jgi:hypothetical protein
MSDHRGGDRASAQRRVNRIRAFRAELEDLIAHGVISLSPDQRRAIASHHDALLGDLSAAHDVDRSETAGQLSRGMRVASFFAALALTAAVYSLVSRFWGRLDLPLQATLLCAFPLMALVAVELAARRERTLYVASIFAIAAFGCYWLAVIELSGLLNIPLAPPALWGGALFGIALALPYRFRLIFGGGLVALLVALAGTAFQAAGIPWTAIAEFPEVITVAALALTLIAPHMRPLDPSFAAVTRIVAFGMAFLGLLILSSSGRASVLPLQTRVAEFVYQALMLLLCVGTLTVAIRKQWLETVYLTAAALTLFLFGRFIDWFWGAFPRYVFFLLLAAVAFGWLLALRKLRGRVELRQR